MLSEILESLEKKELKNGLYVVCLAFSDIEWEVIVLFSFPVCFRISSIVKESSVLNQNLLTRFWIKTLVQTLSFIELSKEE